MSPTPIIIALSALTLLAIAGGVLFWLLRAKLVRRVKRLNEEMLEASRDASVGRRMTIPDDPDTGQLAHTVNRLFDALGERDEEIQGRDRLFKD